MKQNNTNTGQTVQSGLEGEVPLAVGEQVSILIDMATDPNILARQFVGLMSWL